MAFAKGDPRINRKGRPKNAEPDLLRQALAREGVKRGEDFWEKVASFAFTDRNIMIAVIKKFIPDLTHADIDSTITVVKMETVKLDDKEQELNIGNRVAEYPECSN